MGWHRSAIEAGIVRPDGSKISGKILLGRIAGMISGLKQTVDKENGDIQTGLKGNFRGISTKTIWVEKRDKEGKVVTDKDGNKVMEDTGVAVVVSSGVCYLPGGIQEMLEGALKEAQAKDAKAIVNFTIDLFALPSTNRAGYTFSADNIVDTSASDPLDMLLSQAADRKALPAPGDVPTVPVEDKPEVQEEKKD
jgi:hypothetical protein